jgi:hypothetical protein
VVYPWSIPLFPPASDANLFFRISAHNDILHELGEEKAL